MHPIVNRRTLLAGAGITALTAALAACSGGSNQASTSGNKLDAIKSAGKIRIGLEGTFRPFGFHDGSGQLTGFEKEIADLIAKDLGVTAEYIETPWDSLIAGVDSDRYDIAINNIAPTEERKQKYDFSIPYAYSEARVAVSDSSPLKNVSDISGHTSAQSETSNFRQLMEERGAQIVTVAGFDESVELVLSNRAEMTANDFVTFKAYQQEHPDAKIRLLEGEVGEGSNAAILLPKNQQALKDAIDESLRKHLDSGDLKAIYQKYVGADLSPKK